jgi:hypothetical protein
MLASESNPYEPPRCDDSPTAQSAGDSEFVLSGCLTVDDALAAHRLATRGYRPRIALAAMIVVTFSIVLIAIAVSARPYSLQAANVMLLVACVILPALLAVPITIGRYRMHRFARNRFGIFAPTHSTFSPSKIVSTSEDAKSELQWGLFSRCIANDTVAIIYFKNANQYLILARQKLKDPSQWDALLFLIQTSLGGCGDKQRHLNHEELSDELRHARERPNHAESDGGITPAAP